VRAVSIRINARSRRRIEFVEDQQAAMDFCGPGGMRMIRIER
jgi:hypothetical protein